jgi:hypothetical protein
MSRPRGSEVIDMDDVRAAISAVRARTGAGRTTQVAVATELGMSESGLRSWAQRRGLDWRALQTSADKLAVSCRSCPVPTGEDRDMRSLLVPLTPELAEQLRALADAERRHPRHEATVLIEEAIRRRLAAAVRARWLRSHDFGADDCGESGDARSTPTAPAVMSLLAASRRTG